MSRPLKKIINVIVDYRYGLLAAALLSTLALPQWSAASNTRTTSDGRIILAQAPDTDAQKKAKELLKKKGAPNVAPKGQPNLAPRGSQQNLQQNNQPNNLQQGQPKDFRKALPKTQTGRGQPYQQNQQQYGQPNNVQQGQPKEFRKGLPKQQTGQGQQNVLPKGQQFAPKNAQQQRKGAPQTFGNVDQLRSLRRQRTEGGRVIIEEPGRRSIVRENGRVFVRHDDAERFGRLNGARVERRGGEVYTILRRPGGVEIVTVTDANGRLLRRFRRGSDRREIVLIDNRPRAGATGFFLGLAAPRITIPRDRYIVDMEGAPPALLYETLEAEPLMPIERAYSLDEVRYNVELRDRMRRIDIDTIHFESGSWEVAPDQYPALQAIAEAILRVVSDNPSAVFMIEGYTDAVGEDVDNLSLSDRRAESVAEILTGNFNVPPENLVAQGYGEQYLKIPTDGPSRENRRVAVRNITRLLQGASR